MDVRTYSLAQAEQICNAVQKLLDTKKLDSEQTEIAEKVLKTLSNSKSDWAITTFTEDELFFLDAVETVLWGKPSEGG